ncbi:peptidoglycan bridge formation glycyltransferase FemA/FemB family protein, partial [bacterium]|nr:peptidoglycan bridge formation glycyltransferase FemA/FemB family protein [bacterium]
MQKAGLFQIWTPANYDISPLVWSGYSSKEGYTSILNLQKSEEELWVGLKSTARTRIRKAKKNDIGIVSADVSLVETYYEMIMSTFKRTQISIKPQSFYRQVVGRLGRSGM